MGRRINRWGGAGAVAPTPNRVRRPERASPRGCFYGANASGLLLVSGVDGDLVGQVVRLLDCRVNFYITDEC
jgi:hypothetical protein